MGVNTSEEEQKEPIWDDGERYQELFLKETGRPPCWDPTFLVAPKCGGRKDGESERLRGGFAVGH